MPEVEPGGQTDETGSSERSPESIGARVFMEENHGLAVLCPRESYKTVVEEKDEQGRVIKSKRISESGVILYSGEHQYDDRGNSRVVLKDYKGHVLAIVEDLKESTKEGRTEATVYYNAQGKKLCSNECNYDQRGRLQSIVHRDEKGKVSGFNNIEYEYDQHDRESRKVYRDENGDIHMTIEYERDENGRIYHCVVRDAEGNIIDEIGQPREKPESAAGNYGDAGATKETAPEIKTGDKESIEVKYDEHGRIIARIFYSENKNIKMSIEYERDETGKKFHTVIKNDIGIIIEEFWEPGYQEAA